MADGKDSMTKIAIRSRLLAFKDGLPTSEINNWHKGFFKTPIAGTMKEAENWLEKQRDLCKSRGRNDAGEKVWIGVATSATKHVADLIGNQKQTRKKKNQKISKSRDSVTEKYIYSSSSSRKIGRSSISAKPIDARIVMTDRKTDRQVTTKSPVSAKVMAKNYSDRKSCSTRTFNGFKMEQSKEYESSQMSISASPKRPERRPMSSSSESSSSESENERDKHDIISAIRRQHEKQLGSESTGIEHQSSQVGSKSTGKKKHGVQEMRLFIMTQLATSANQMQLTELLDILNQEFMVQKLKRRGLTMDKFLTILNSFEEFEIRGNSLRVVNPTTEQSSETDSGTDASSLKSFVSHESECLRGVPTQPMKSPGMILEELGLPDMIKEAEDAKNEVFLLRAVETELETQIEALQLQLTENKGKLDKAQCNFEIKSIAVLKRLGDVL